MTVFAASKKSTARFLALSLGISSVVLLWIVGCASTGGSTWGGPPPIPEGKGRFYLETGGISEVNFYVIDQETDDEVYSETPRMSASSPARYERGGVSVPQYVDLPPGKYSLVVNTDIQEPVEVPDIEVRMGEERYVQVPIGRFQLLYYTQGEQGLVRSQVPFLIYDFNMSTVLGKGMTSTEISYFITPVGTYKVRIENSPSGLDEQRPVQVSFGRPQNISIEPAAQPSGPAEEEGPPQN
jgi:hypothetical protein